MKQYLIDNKLLMITFPLHKSSNDEFIEKIRNYVNEECNELNKKGLVSVCYVRHLKETNEPVFYIAITLTNINNKLFNPKFQYTNQRYESWYADAKFYITEKEL